MKRVRAIGLMALGLLTLGAGTASAQQLPTGRTDYRTLESTNAELQTIAADHPDTVKLIKLSQKSLLGRDILGIEIAHRVNDDDGRPTFYVGGVLHSREWPSVEFSMEFAHDLLNNDGTDPQITRLLENGRVTIVPMQQPDGYDVSRRNVNNNQQKRGNCRFSPGQIPTQEQCDAANSVNQGVNSNRNFGAFWGGNGSSTSMTSTNYGGEAPLSEPENKAYDEYLSTTPVMLGLDMHTPDRRLLSVQASRNEPSVIADQEVYTNLTTAIAEKNLVGWPSGPWTSVYYEASSTEEQHTYYVFGAFGYTTEATPGYRGTETYHPPYQAVIDNYWGIGQYPGATIRGTLLDMYEATQNTSLHSVISGTAPAGAKLTVTKDFTWDTSPAIWAPGGEREVRSFPQHLQYDMTVPADGKFEWHLNPSERPSQYSSEFLPESYTLTCAAPDGTILQTTSVRIGRGQSANLSLCTQGEVGGTVPATLGLTLGDAASFGAFTPGVGATYEASTTATVISTAADAALSVVDGSSSAPGHLVNGSFTLPSALEVSATKQGGTAGTFTALGADPVSLLSYDTPVANDLVTLGFRQAIGAADALRTGTYAKTLTYTLSTTNP